MTQPATRQAAIAAGSATYDGAQCKRHAAHGTKRYTLSGGCCGCVRAASDANKLLIKTRRNELKASLGVICGR